MSNYNMELLAQQIASLRRETDAKHVKNQSDISEFKSTLKEILQETRKTNGRVTVLEATLHYLKDEWQIIRKRYHELVNLKQANGGGENATVTRIDIRTAIALFVGGGATIMFLLKLMGKL